MTIAKILEMLNDRQWHTLGEIQQETKITKKQTKQIIQFLKEYNFITTDKTEEKIMLNKTVQKFLTQTATS